MRGHIMRQYWVTGMIRGDGGRTLRAILDRICNKWTLLIVATLDQGPVRFSDLHQQVPGDLSAHADPDPAKPRARRLGVPHGVRGGPATGGVHADPDRQEPHRAGSALAGWAIEHVPHVEASRAAYEASRPRL
ncbi:hypothetical protein GCM10023170_031080 [Phytohabitans houttuyneae]|uniref:HTH hxlR-type domain-containing protein n=1 Tax=Phytohabitans houttuyneae TaxID=1076126 RepID=A0A6V8K2X1_9ACTN|nr:hypothetical protein Phou_022540 [Phytohabitans houttuyneae]